MSPSYPKFSNLILSSFINCSFSSIQSCQFSLNSILSSCLCNLAKYPSCLLISSEKLKRNIGTCVIESVFM